MTAAATPERHPSIIRCSTCGRPRYKKVGPNRPGQYQVVHMRGWCASREGYNARGQWDFLTQCEEAKPSKAS